jgi:hypothetical protein
MEVNPMRALLMIPEEDPPKLVESATWSKEFNEFLTKCLSKDAAGRSSAAELLKVGSLFIMFIFVAPILQASG